MNENDILMHYGTPHYNGIPHSGRYEYGSGENPYQRTNDFYGMYKKLRYEGLSDNDIAVQFDISVNELRKMRSIAAEQDRLSRINQVKKLKEKGYSNVKIGEMLGIGESTVRELYSASQKENANKTEKLRNSLKDVVEKKGMIDIGTGVELELGTTQTRLKTAVKMLEDEGYETYSIYVEQANNPGQYTTVKVLCKPGTEKSYVLQNKDKIETVTDSMTLSRDEIDITEYPSSISSNRVFIRYADGTGTNTDGLTKDGVIELRRGVKDLDLGNSNYAQVRIAVDGTHYLKGMAMYSDDIPDGFDVVFNTNKTSDIPKMKVLKALKDDEDLPFGAKIKANGQYHYIDENGERKLGAINKVNEEGDWDTWSKTLSSQMLSKQNVPLIKRQLNLSLAEKKEEYDTIMSLTNPVIKKQLLNAFASDLESSAVDLKAAALPGQKSHVILPFNDLKETEIYAPNYKNGERVVLIRYPHGGLFEIPELVVNNKKSSAKDIIGNAIDAVGINSKVAERLSGADFDGDTVLVIPVNDKVKISTAPPLKALKGFDPKDIYKLPDDAPKMKSQTKQNEMGKVSNLITDMTIKGASYDEISKAVKHSMVVIDAEKHHLDYKKSYKDNDIAALKAKWQGIDPKTGALKGASTLISRASGEQHIPERELVNKYGKKTYTADPDTGEFIFKPTGRTYTDKNGKTHLATETVATMAITKNAFDISSGTQKEAAYATYANKLKSLANTCRKDALALKGLEYSPSAAKIFKNEVESLDAKLGLALKNAPRERKAQLVTAAKVESLKKDNPNVDKEYLKKYKQQTLTNARIAAGANKSEVSIKITENEWKAIQSGAITTSKLTKIINNTNLDDLKKLATPRVEKGLTNAQIALIKSMEKSGFTTSEIAERIGKSASTVNKYLRE